ncbi:GNAT family N-acetyltransferase [Providencia rettgeri]|uniref:GNAT family N-acetyltransferase n=1 Tax=Providencia TaxID=586 RepID=UPI00226ED9D0|nr:MULTISPECIES: GNAT family N-acetyltransferase [Providencia]MCX9094550.1 GNAT family N-acetyltransferase [Providencia rettgeri]HEM6844229.1 GNAT family N-acetyltransferase [Providencia rettgeri]
MISNLKHSEIEQVLKIWLDSSIKAHDFISKDFWCDKIDDMRNIYIPSTMTRVFSEDNTILGFYCLSDQLLNALFVSPSHQNIGIGSMLLSDAKKHNNKLNLAVYKENKQAISFYKKHHFTIKSEEIDPHTKQLELLMEWVAD